MVPDDQIEKIQLISYPSSEVHLCQLLAGKHGGLSLNNVDFDEIHTFTPTPFIFTFHAPQHPSEREDDGS